MFAPRLSSRLKALRPSATIALSDRARELAASGRSIITLSAGEPDFDTPPNAIEAAYLAMQSGFTHYTGAAGIPELRKAIAEKLRRDNDVEVNPDGGVLVIPGAKQGAAYACLAFLDEGDECLVPEPAWVSFREMITLAGGKYVPLPSRPEDGFTIDADVFRSSITDRTRLMILNTPTNPTGKVWSRQELEMVAEASREHGFIVLADEIYETIVYDGHEHVSLASLPGMADRCLTLNGLSKSHAMTGWRLGYVAGAKELVKPLLTLQQHTATCAGSFAQKGAVAAMEAGSEAPRAMQQQFLRRRDMLMKRFSDVQGMSVWQPQGTFYMFLDVRQTGKASTEVSEYLLDKQGVALTPGDAFGDSGSGFLRLSFAASEETLAEAADRIARGLRELIGS